MSIETTECPLCPQCQSEQVHWSRSKGLERLARFVGVGFFRCHACSNRFRAFRWWGPSQRNLLIFVLGWLVFVVLLWCTLEFTNRPVK